MTRAELLNIMSNAVVTTGNLKNAESRGQPELVAFKLVTGFTATKAGTTVPVYTITNTDNAMTGFLAYICDYEQGSTKYVTLGSQADFMFTITMNGCTFGIGMPAGSGDVTVCHSNTSKGFGGNTPPDLQAQMQRFQVEQLLPLGGSILEPANYRTVGREQCTTFGMRDNNGWQFWMHTYSYTGNQRYTYGATNQITGNQYALAPAWNV